MKCPSFPVESYEFTLSNKNQSVFVLHRDFPCSMPALQNLSHQPAETPFWEHLCRFTFRPRIKYSSDTWSSLCDFRCSSFAKWSQRNAMQHRESESSKNCAICQFVLVFAHKYHTSSKISINRCFTGHQVTLLKRLCCWSQRWVQVEETRAVSAGPTQEFTKFKFWSSCLGDDLNVTRVTRVRCPSSCFIKTLCLESTLHIKLSRPIVPCIKKSRWTAGILSMLQLIRSDAEQPWLAVVGSWRRDLVPENSDFWRMDKESWERVTSVTAPVIWAFRSFLLDYKRSFRQHLRRHLLGSFAGTYCSKGSWFWILQHPTCLSLHSALILIPYTVRVSGCFR